jgi:hypothetical protein
MTDNKQVEQIASALEQIVNALDACFGVMMQTSRVETGTVINPYKWTVPNGFIEARAIAEKMYYEAKALLREDQNVQGSDTTVSEQSGEAGSQIDWIEIEAACEHWCHMEFMEPPCPAQVMQWVKDNVYSPLQRELREAREEIERLKEAIEKQNIAIVKHLVDKRELKERLKENQQDREVERMKWVKVEDELPKLGQTVLTFPHYNVLPFGNIESEKEGTAVDTTFWNWKGDEETGGCVVAKPFPTHWMPLPAPPSLDSTPNTQADEDVRDYEGLEPYERVLVDHISEAIREVKTDGKLYLHDTIDGNCMEEFETKEQIERFIRDCYIVDGDVHPDIESLHIYKMVGGIHVEETGGTIIRDNDTVPMVKVEVLLNTEQSVQECDATKSDQGTEPMANNSQPTPKEEDVEKMAEEYAGVSIWINKNEKNPTEQQHEFHEYIAKNAFIAGYNAAKTTK